MRAFPPVAPPEVRLSVDEGAIVVGLLDFLIEPTMHPTDDVVGLARRSRQRVSAALAHAITDDHAGLDARFERLRDDFYDLQVAFRAQSDRVEETIERAAELRKVAREVRSLVGETGPLTLDAGDDRLRELRAELARLAA
jgi:hypothetical protein